MRLGSVDIQRFTFKPFLLLRKSVNDICILAKIGFTFAVLQRYYLGIMDDTKQLKSLGTARAKYTGLEIFEKPKHCGSVRLVSDEVTAVCPVTAQPDFYTVDVEYHPHKSCVESKTFKLFVQSFRDQGHFCEKFADLILEEMVKALDPIVLRVIVTQKPRGGVAIISESVYSRPTTTAK